VEWNFGDILLTMIAFFFWFTFVWMFIGVFADIFRRTDLSGLSKALWIFVVAVLPFIGVLGYLLTRPAVVEGPAQPVAAPGTPSGHYSASEEIAKAARLQAEGAITPSEFATLKEQALARQKAV
jgi:predicted membrane channel-forming protein YqfA (hemolysin III family)